jgi:N6-adenosine-specific RNA methylase IME4
MTRPDAGLPEGGAYHPLDRQSVGNVSIWAPEEVRDPHRLLRTSRLGSPDSTLARLARPLALSGGIVTLARYGGEAKEHDRHADEPMRALEELSRLTQSGEKFGTILIDPPWRFRNLTGKVGPEHRRLYRYPTMGLEEIAALPIDKLGSTKSHLYLWCPNALLLEALSIMKIWGFDYKTNIVWFKVRKDGGPDGRGVGFYFRNVTELLLFGSKGGLRTLKPGRTQVNIVIARKQEHSRKPEVVYDLIQRCSPGPYLELFARERVPGWTQWGDEVDTYRRKRPPQTQLKLSRS